jgi:non-specific serine/threonine protein kinase
MWLGELFSPIRLTVNEAFTILKEMETYEEAGVMCKVSDWWSQKRNSLRLFVKGGEKEP